MKRFLIFLMALGLTVLSIVPALAASSDTQVVQFQILAIDELDASGNPGMLTINSATAGSSTLTPATDGSTTYALTTNGTNRKITGQITSGGDMPANTNLEVQLIAPTGGSSPGYVFLTSGSAADLVTSITQLAESGKTITYRFSATLAAGTVSGSRTVTLTLTGS